MQVVAIGGGGFSRRSNNLPQNLLIEEFILKQTGVKRPSICFIPTASGEAPKYIVDFYFAFNLLDCVPSHLSLFEPPTADLESFLLQNDAIYVGGGNTKSMLALWKEWKIDKFLRKAYEKGIVLAGVSAGANCWFEECVTDSIPGDLTSLECLGFLKGSCCPHYDGEKNRKPAYHSLIKANKVAPGLAIDDCAAAHFIDGRLAKVVRSNESGKAYLVFNEQSEIIEMPIESHSLVNSVL